MKRTLLYAILAIFCTSSFYSCKKLDPLTDVQKCPHATDGLIVKKWASVVTQVDKYNAGGTIESTTYAHPVGFLQIKSGGAYSAISDGLSVTGKWSIDDKCDLALDAGGELGVTFDIVKLDADSLVIRQKSGSSVITQKFAGYSCNCAPYLTKKWANAYTQIDTYNSDGVTLAGTSTIHPVGFFQLSSDGTYRVLSDNVPLNGSWIANEDYCQVTLDSATSLQRTFDILKASNDSLVIRRKAGNIIYTQHYSAVTCPSLTELERTWDNVSIRTDYVSGGVISGTDYIFPVGTFRLNADATYNVNSNGTPLDGSWLLQDEAHGCPLVLDNGAPLQRSFDILKISTDSLTIWRLDATAGAAYTQTYKKE